MSKLLDLSYLSENYYECKSFLHYLKGKLHKNTNEIKKAIDSFKISVNLDNKNIDAYLNLLNLLESTNELDELNLYIKLSLQNSNSIVETNKIIYFKSLLLFRNKKYKQALKLITQKINRKFSK